MICQEVEVFVSAVHDGEEVPREAAEHIFGCEECRSKLKAYSDIGMELRLVANLQDNSSLTPAGVLDRKRSWMSRLWTFLWQRMSVPRYAMLTLLCLLAVSVAVIPLVRAQSKSMWFLFGIAANKSRTPVNWIPATDGYNDVEVLTYGGPVNAIAVRVAVTHVAENWVSLRVKARLYHDFQHVQTEKLSLQNAVEVSYVPGQSVDIPVEGGGTVHLVGRIEDHQPKIAWGQPLELDSNQFIVRSPVLVSGNERIGELQGATAIAAADHDCVLLGTGANGRFLFALHPFPGAVEGQVNWGELTFKMDGNQYRLVSPAPIAGGDQPRKAWVRHDPVSDVPKFALGVLPLPK